MTRTEALAQFDKLTVQTMRANARMLKARGATQAEIAAHMRSVLDEMEGTKRDLAAAFDEFFGDSDEAPGEVELHR